MDLPGLFRRGVANMRIQASLTAAAINLKQQGVALLASLVRWLGYITANAWPLYD